MSYARHCAILDPNHRSPHFIKNIRIIKGFETKRTINEKLQPSKFVAKFCQHPQIFEGCANCRIAISPDIEKAECGTRGLSRSDVFFGLVPKNFEILTTFSKDV
jgi:hypothetical protein